MTNTAACWKSAMAAIKKAQQKNCPAGWPGPFWTGVDWTQWLVSRKQLAKQLQIKILHLHSIERTKRQAAQNKSCESSKSSSRAHNKLQLYWRLNALAHKCQIHTFRKLVASFHPSIHTHTHARKGTHAHTHASLAPIPIASSLGATQWEILSLLAWEPIACSL